MRTVHAAMRTVRVEVRTVRLAMGIVQLVMGTARTAMGAARIAAGIVPLAPGAVQRATRTTRAAMRTACRDSAAAQVMADGHRSGLSLIHAGAYTSNPPAIGIPSLRPSLAGLSGRFRRRRTPLSL